MGRRLRDPTLFFCRHVVNIGHLWTDMHYILHKTMLSPPSLQGHHLQKVLQSAVSKAESFHAEKLQELQRSHLSDLSHNPPSDGLRTLKNASKILWESLSRLSIGLATTDSYSLQALPGRTRRSQRRGQDPDLGRGRREEDRPLAVGPEVAQNDRGEQDGQGF